MNCDQQRVSLLIDGELAPDEARLVIDHLAACQACRSVRDQFLLLRGAIKSLHPEAELYASRDGIEEIQARPRVTIWKRSIAVPMPAMAALVVALIALAFSSIYLSERGGRVGNRPGARLAPAAISSQAAGQPDLSAFDHGGRAEIIAVSRLNLDAGEPGGDLR